jgi:predicted transcriptional regulator of viral defense system
VKSNDLAVKRNTKGNKSKTGWNALVKALRQRTTISRAELSKLIQEHSRVSIDYALWRLQQEGVLRRTDQRRRTLYVVMEKGTEVFIRDPIEAVQTVYGTETLFGYGTALFVHGLSRYGRLTEIYVISSKAQRRKEIGGNIVRLIKSPLQEEMGTINQKYGKHSIRITDLERTLIDCIHRPKYAQGWENIVHALYRTRSVDTGKMVEYVKLYRTPSLVAKVGFILEQFSKKWQTASDDLDSLRQYLPEESVKFDEERVGKLNKRWNLYVPEGLLDE